MLIPFPIAFFTGSLIADVVYFMTDSDFWTTMGTVLIGFGIVGALLAALFGFIDYRTAPMGPKTKQIATTHMIINLAVVALYLVNFLLRRQTPEIPIGYALSVIGILGLLAAGWFGGALVFEHHVGAAPTPASAPTAVASSDRPRVIPADRQPVRR
jgi:uncharacterized membrane protein